MFASFASAERNGSSNLNDYLFKYDGKNICCVNPWDGDVNNPECRNGVSYAYWKPGEKVKYYGHLEKSIKNNFDKEGIKELTK